MACLKEYNYLTYSGVSLRLTLVLLSLTVSLCYPGCHSVKVLGQRLAPSGAGHLRRPVRGGLVTHASLC
jgi:hypothetical protein